MEPHQQHNLVLEEEEEEVGLQRQSCQFKHLNDNNNNAAAVVFSTNGNGNVNVNGNGNGSVATSSSSSIDSETVKTAPDDKDILAEEGIPRNHDSVYFDKERGTDSVHMKYDGVTNSVSETTSKDVEILGTEKNLANEINNQLGGSMDIQEFSDSKTAPLEDSFKEQNIKSKPAKSEIRLAADFDLVEEIDQEATDFDVENVLDKQNTHDLYCPNCHSCITKRVILRRRRRKLRIPCRKPIPDRISTSLGSEFDASSTHSSTDQVHDAANIVSHRSPMNTTDEDNVDREPDVFRCLSCFSFFIPTGNGFKLFRAFGGGTQNENTQHPQELPAGNRNWLISIFTTDKRKPTGDTVQQLNLPSSSDTITDQYENGQGHSVTPIASTLDDGGESGEGSSLKPQQGGVNSTVSSTHEPLTLEQSQLGIGENFNMAVGNEKPIQNGQASPAQATSSFLFNKLNCGAPASHAIVDAVEQLNLPYFSDTTPDQHENGHIVTPNVGNPFKIGERDADSHVRPQQGGVNSPIPSTHESLAPEKSQLGVGENFNMEWGNEEPIQNDQASTIQGGEVLVMIESTPPEYAASQWVQNIEEATEERRGLLQSVDQASMGEQRGVGAHEAREWDILKSIVYGGLMESITSLGVVSSAAGGGATTLNTLALGLANLIGGLFVIGHNLKDLKNDRSGGVSEQTNQQEDRYREILGKRENFTRHAIAAILSYIIFGLLPPVIYGFSFCKSDDKDLKLAAVGVSSLLCIILLAIGKAHTRRQEQKFYIRTVLYFVTIGLMASGASYIVGDLINKLLENVWPKPSLAVASPFANSKPIELASASIQALRV